eukprot:gene11629-4871_t
MLFYVPHVSVAISSVGLVLILFFCIGYLILTIANKEDVTENEEEEEETSDYEEKKLKFSIVSFIERNVAIFVVFLLAFEMLIILGFIIISHIVLEKDYGLDDVQGYLIFFYVSVGTVFVLTCGAGIFGLIYGFLSIIKFFRKIVFTINEFFRQYGLKIVWIFLSLSYLPISKTVYGMLVCTPSTCPNNYHSRNLPMTLVRLETSFVEGFNTTKDRTCMNCGIRDASYSCPVAIYNSVCMSSTQIRLQSDHLISCDSSFFGLFIPLAMVLTIFVVIGLPMLGCYAITH